MTTDPDPPTPTLREYKGLPRSERLRYRLLRPFFAERILQLSPRNEGGFRVAEFYQWPDKTIDVIHCGDIAAYSHLITKATRVVLEGGANEEGR